MGLRSKCLQYFLILSIHRIDRNDRKNQLRTPKEEARRKKKKSAKKRNEKKIKEMNERKKKEILNKNHDSNFSGLLN